MLLINQELRLQVAGRFSALAFVDAGNVWRSASDVDIGDLRLSMGPGLSVATPAGPIRVYYGFNVDPEPGEDGGRFHLTFGPTF